MPLRLAILTNILPPYRVPLFNYLAAQPDICLRIFLCAKSESDRNWDWPENIQFDYEIGSSWTFKAPSGKPAYFVPGLVLSLWKFKPDVIIVGSLGVVGLAALISTKLTGAGLVLWSESTEISESQRARRVLFLRKFLVRRAQAYIGVSNLAAKYFCRLGAKEEKIHVSLQTLDVQTFSRTVNKHRAMKNEIKRQFGLTGSVIAFIGNLEPYKGTDLLLETYLKLLDYAPAVELLLVGTGKLEEQLKQQTKKVRNAKVHFIGFKQHQDLPLYYAVTDLFCLFSRSETFGIVVVEAVAAGLPIMCSKFAGAAFDLVENGKNGYIIDPFEIDVNANLMSKMVLNDKNLEQMGYHSLELANKCTIEKAATTMLDAVHHATIKYRGA